MTHKSLVVAAILAASSSFAQESSDPIKLTLHDWVWPIDYHDFDGPSP